MTKTPKWQPDGSGIDPESLDVGTVVEWDGQVSHPPSQAVIEAVEQAFRVHVVQGLGWKCTCGVNVEDFAGYERHSYTEVARAAEQAADEKWMRWLIEQLHYGIDTSCEVDPPCTLADYAAMWERIDPREKHMAEVIVAETGAWADELTDTDDRSMS
jgi:hypothetical protein